jgi:hypothetical protein
VSQKRFERRTPSDNQSAATFGTNALTDCWWGGPLYWPIHCNHYTSSEVRCLVWQDPVIVSLCREMHSRVTECYLSWSLLTYVKDMWGCFCITVIPLETGLFTNLLRCHMGARAWMCLLEWRKGREYKISSTQNFSPKTWRKRPFKDLEVDEKIIEKRYLNVGRPKTRWIHDLSWTWNKPKDLILENNIIIVNIIKV